MLYPHVWIFVRAGILLSVDADWLQRAFDDVIAVGFEPDLLDGLYEEVTVLETFSCERCMARENGLIIARARHPSVSPADLRERIRRFYFF